MKKAGAVLRRSFVKERRQISPSRRDDLERLAMLFAAGPGRETVATPRQLQVLLGTIHGVSPVR